MARVFVIQNPHQADGDGGMKPKYDLSKAKKYGDFVYLLSPGAKPFAPNERVIEELREKLSQFDDDDYLLLIGNPALIGFACAIAADFNDGRVSVLQWSTTRKDYVPIRADLGKIEV